MRNNIYVICIIYFTGLVVLIYFGLLLQGGHLSFSTVHMSVMHTFSMMLGEIDFLNIFVYPYFGHSTKGDLLLFPVTTFGTHTHTVFNYLILEIKEYEQ